MKIYYKRYVRLVYFGTKSTHITIIHSLPWLFPSHPTFSVIIFAALSPTTNTVNAEFTYGTFGTTPTSEFPIHCKHFSLITAGWYTLCIAHLTYSFSASSVVTLNIGANHIYIWVHNLNDLCLVHLACSFNSVTFFAASYPSRCMTCLENSTGCIYSSCNRGHSFPRDWGCKILGLQNTGPFVKRILLALTIRLLDIVPGRDLVAVLYNIGGLAIRVMKVPLPVPGLVCLDSKGLQKSPYDDDIKAVNDVVVDVETLQLADMTKLEICL